MNVAMVTALTERPPSLPAPLTPLVGRAREIAIVTQLLCDPDVRLVTLTGPGGVGKTRLALAVAAASAGQFADGVRFVSLAAVTNAERVHSTLAEQLGIREATDRSQFEQIVAALQHQQLLLLIDTFEHLLPAARH